MRPFRRASRFATVALRRALTRCCIATVLVTSVASAQRTESRLANGLARTPPMGWNSWNRFGCNVSDRLIRETADALVANGMRDAGYTYLTIDDCWQVARNAQGVIVADSARFPAGIKALADYVHSKGLKFGIYTDAGTKTCEGRPGSYGHEALDARTYASWGVDYVKVDWCNSDGLDAPTQYRIFRDAIAASGRPIVMSICEWGRNRPWEWAPAVGNLWRTTGDIADRWSSVLSIVDLSSQYWSVAGPGGWNDPDMLEVGNGGMTATEYRSHFSLWAMMAAPLIAGNDVRAMMDSSTASAATRQILLNKEVIAIDQDPLGAQATITQANPSELQVWVKPLADGSRAVLLFNRASVPTTITTDWARAGVKTNRARVRDIWAGKDSAVVTDRYAALVPSHGVVLLRVWPIAP
jgi:alpha-galactosidase